MPQAPAAGLLKSSIDFLCRRENQAGPAYAGPAAFNSRSGQTLKLTATIRPTETRTITVEAEDYAAAKAQIEGQVPEGWIILQILNTP